MSGPFLPISSYDIYWQIYTEARLSAVGGRENGSKCGFFDKSLS